MGITLKGAGAAAQGALDAGLKKREDMRAQAEENRTARDDQFSQAYKKIMQERPDVQQQQQQTAGPAGPAGPAQAIPGGTPAGGAPAGGAPASQQFDSRRSHYRHWKKGAQNAALMAGGLEGLTAFNDSENLNSMQEMQTWGEQGVAALANNSPADAARFFNTMFEVSPEDFGLEAEAFNGKLYLKGKDGKRGAPVGQAEAMAYLDTFLKTPDNFLNVQEQRRKEAADAESRRAAGVAEGITEREARVSERAQDVVESAERRENKYAERLMQTKEGTTLAQLINAKANSKRALQSALDATDNGWTTGQIQKVMSDTDEWSLNDLAELGDDGSVQQYYTDHPLAWNNLKSDVTYLQLAQPPGAATMITREDASMVSQLIRQPAGLDAQKAGMAPGDFKIGLLEDGSIAAIKEGRPIRLTPELLGVWREKNPDQAVAMDEARKALTGSGGVLPAATKSGGEMGPPEATKSGGEMGPPAPALEEPPENTRPGIIETAVKPLPSADGESLGDKFAKVGAGIKGILTHEVPYGE
jgi:hypothetical protein